MTILNFIIFMEFDSCKSLSYVMEREYSTSFGVNLFLRTIKTKKKIYFYLYYLLDFVYFSKKLIRNVILLSVEINNEHGLINTFHNSYTIIIYCLLSYFDCTRSIFFFLFRFQNKKS